MQGEHLPQKWHIELKVFQRQERSVLERQRKQAPHRGGSALWSQFQENQKVLHERMDGNHYTAENMQAAEVHGFGAV